VGPVQRSAMWGSRPLARCYSAAPATVREPVSWPFTNRRVAWACRKREDVPVRPFRSQIRWCCETFRSYCDEVGGRGLAVVVEDIEIGPTFLIQCRSIDPAYFTLRGQVTKTDAGH
jgi:hypothetical protein